MKKFILVLVLMPLLLRAEGDFSELNPVGSIQGFLDLLVGARVEEASDAAVFSDPGKKAEFIGEWKNQKGPLSGYRIEGWTLQAGKGSAEVKLRLRDSDREEPLELLLVRVNGEWKVSPEKNFGAAPAAPPPPPPVENLEGLVDVTSKTVGRQIELSVMNKAPFSVLLRVDMDLPATLRADCPVPLSGILARTETPLPLCNLEIVGRSGWKYSWSYTVKRADDAGEMAEPGTLTLLPEVPQDENAAFYVGGKYAYGVPYPAGRAYLIWQGPGGSYSHTEPGSFHAVDFSMPLGSEVAAARSGVVVGVIQKNPDNPEGETAEAIMANEVLILHADGTLGVYAHLTTDGSRVSFGQVVQRGQVIGLSGNSGYSRGPHLHFAILGYEERESVSLPFGFLSHEGTVVTPRKGLILLAQQDGTAKSVEKETTPRRIVRKHYEEFDTEIRYFAKTVDFLAANKMTELVGVELTLMSLENLISPVALPHRVGVAADGEFHPMVSLQVVNLEDSPAFSYIFRRVEAPGREHVPLRVEQEPGDDYDIEIRYFSGRIEFHAKNKTPRLLMGSLEFPSLENLSLKEKSPIRVRLPADGETHYLASLLIAHPTKGYSFTYRVGPGKAG